MDKEPNSYSFRQGCVEYRCSRCHPEAMTGYAFEARTVNESGEPTSEWRRNDASSQWVEEILRIVAERQIYKDLAALNSKE